MTAGPDGGTTTGAGEPTLPVIDLGAFADLVPSPSAIAELDSACREVGFFAAIGHGLDEELIERVLGVTRTFFAQPLVSKEAVAIGRSSNHTGYVGLAAERLDADRPPDHKEAVDLALEPVALRRASAAGSGTGVDHDGPAPGVNPPIAVVGFADAVVDYQRAALLAALAALRGLALALDLDADHFTAMMTRPPCNLRLLRYPPVAARQPRPGGGVGDGGPGLGCGAHSDYGLITLLLTDGTAGLEVQRVDGTWIEATAPPGALIVNLGDMLARWTNDRYRSTPHRVRSPVGVDRYSIPFFVNPDPEVVVAPLPSCVEAGEVSPYRPVRAGDYLRSRFDDTHAYRR